MQQKSLLQNEDGIICCNINKIIFILFNISSGFFFVQFEAFACVICFWFCFGCIDCCLYTKSFLTEVKV